MAMDRPVKEVLTGEPGPGPGRVRNAPFHASATLDLVQTLHGKKVWARVRHGGADTALAAPGAAIARAGGAGILHARLPGALDSHGSLIRAR
jgi:hypothetical protein